MTPARTRWVVLCTHGIHDPLVSALMLDYLVQLQARGADREVLLFTEEPPGTQDDQGLRQRLAAAHIRWVPLAYDVKGAQWRQKGRNLRRIWKDSRAFLRGAGERWLVGYLSFGGTYALLLGLLGLGRTATICFEPHSRYMVELGIWGRRSLKAFFMRAMEWAQMRYTDVLLVPTRSGEALARRSGRKRGLALQPITIDVGRCLHDPGARAQYRTQIGLRSDEVVIGYVGKFDGIYLSVPEYLMFLLRLHHVRPELRFLIVAGHADLQAVRRDPLFGALGDVLVLHDPVPPDELHRVLSAADWGVIAVPPTPAQAYRTPVKTAHYWAAGLPLIIPRGVSDDHSIATAEGVGVVVDDLRTIDAGALLNAMDTLREPDPVALRERCIHAAWRHRDSSHMIRLIRTLLP